MEEMLERILKVGVKTVTDTEISRNFKNLRFLIEYSTNFCKKILLKFLEISVSVEFSPQIKGGSNKIWCVTIDP